MTDRHIEAMEARRLMTFATLDTSFATGGVRTFASGADNAFLAAHADASVTPVADGRVVVDDRTGIFYLNGDGNLDRKRGDNGTGQVLFKSSRAKAADTAVNRATGRLASLLPSTSDTSKITLEVRAATGGVLASLTIDNVRPIATAGARVAPMSDGGWAVVLPRQTTASSSSTTPNVDVYRVVRRAPKDEQLVALNGSSFRLPANPAAASGAVSSVGVDALQTDDKDRIYLVFTTTDTVSGGVFTSRTAVLRLSSTLTLDASWNTSTGRTLASSDVRDDPSQTQFVEIVDDVTVSRGGSVFAIVSRTPTKVAPTDDPAGTSAILRRVDSGGSASSRTLEREKYDISSTFGGRIALGDDGLVYVTLFENNGVGHIYRYHSQLTLDDAWSDFGDYVTTTASTPAAADGFAVDRDGRLLYAGTSRKAAGTKNGRTFGLTVFDGRAEDVAGAKPGALALLADGTVVVRGTPLRDAIIMSVKKDILAINVGSYFKRLDANRVRGLVVMGGNGDDQIRLSSANIPQYVVGQAGNDTIVGTSRDDTLVGDSGDDLLIGKGGNDDLYGQDGKDVVLGGDGADELFGGAGDDLVYASADELPAGNVNDGFTDRLDGGRGVDVLDRDTVTGALGDIVNYKPGEDTLS